MAAPRPGAVRATAAPLLTDWPRCGRFVPVAAAACPLCVAPHRGPAGRPVRGALALAGCAGLAVTLAACYGGPCGGSVCRPLEPPPQGNGAGACSHPATDRDGDGYCGPADCDEGDPRVHAGAPDTPGDGLDHSCDGKDG